MFLQSALEMSRIGSAHSCLVFAFQFSKLINWRSNLLFITVILIFSPVMGLPLDEKSSGNVGIPHRLKRDYINDDTNFCCIPWLLIIRGLSWTGLGWALTFFLQRYLMQYGYLPMSDMETGNLRTEKQLREAIKVMQRFGHIPQTGVVDDATRALMRKPRCSLPDILPEDAVLRRRNSYRRRSKRFIRQGSKWQTNKLTWGVRSYPARLRENTGNPNDLSKWQVQREFRLATEVWGRVSKLEFTELDSNPGDAEIIIDFQGGYHSDGYPFDGPGGTLAHAFYPGDGVGGDMHFDTEEPWVQHKDSNRTYQDISLFITAAHELGHSLGLYHSDVEGSLMSPYLLKFPQDFQLPEDDVKGIQELYGMADDWRPDNREPERELPSYDHTTPRPHRPSPPPSRRPKTRGSTEKPNTCDTDYDAISVIRREIYIFKGKYFWRVDGKGKPKPNYPAEILRFWQMLPSNLTKVDAVYERPNDGNIVFFIGPRYYVVRGNEVLIETGPLRKFGLPKELEHIDAAFIWGHNGRTYFFAQTMYWRFEEDIEHVELDYPRDMVMWRGVPYNIDSAFKYNGTTYFFKGKSFYEFDDLRMRATNSSPLLSAPFWFSCPNTLRNPYFEESQQITSSAHDLHLSLNTPVLLALLISFTFFCGHTYLF